MLRDQADGAAVPQPLGLSAVPGETHADILAARTARACRTRCAWR
jgi:hypothetical protein